MRRNSLRLLGQFAIGAALLGFSAFPAAAQNMTYTLSGVTFDDGGTASGYVVFNPTTSTFIAFDIKVTAGTSDGMAGFEYTTQNVPSPYTITYPNSQYYQGYYLFQFISTAANQPFYEIGLNVYGDPTVLGTDQLHYGTGDANGMGFTDSGEEESSGAGTGFQARGIDNGSILVTPAPEPSQTAALSLGTLTLTGLALKARRRRATAA